ncbi:MAG TPA: hypothetical protein GXX64_10080 [Bacteroidales bacterium]|nr:hypothetical protein [Bacteroidales bacterium]
MFKTNIKTLFKEIRSIPLESADPDLLAHISFGFRNLLILAYTMPWVTETLGDEAAPPCTYSAHDGGVRQARQRT